jgi:hypothetical protein
MEFEPPDAIVTLRRTIFRVRLARENERVLYFQGNPSLLSGNDLLAVLLVKSMALPDRVRLCWRRRIAADRACIVCEAIPELILLMVMLDTRALLVSTI